MCERECVCVKNASVSFASAHTRIHIHAHTHTHIHEQTQATSWTPQSQFTQAKLGAAPPYQPPPLPVMPQVLLLCVCVHVCICVCVFYLPVLLLIQYMQPVYFCPQTLLFLLLKLCVQLPNNVWGACFDHPTNTISCELLTHTHNKP